MRSLRNHVSEIHTITSNLETTLEAGTLSSRYVPTGDNPKDDITRGLHPAELNVEHRYKDGPEFLYKLAALWPQNKVTALGKKTTRG